MASPRRSAHLGLISACILTVSSLGVLVAGARTHSRSSASSAVARNLGTLPAFSLSDTAGATLTSAELTGTAAVLYFFNVRCPASNDYAARLADLAGRYDGDARVRFVGVHTVLPTAARPDGAADVGADGPASAAEVKVQLIVTGAPFRTLLDADGTLAAALGVAGGPTVVVVDPAGRIRYLGAPDDNRDRAKVTTNWARDAIDALIAPETADATPSVADDVLAFRAN